MCNLMAAGVGWGQRGKGRQMKQQAEQGWGVEEGCYQLRHCCQAATGMVGVRVRGGGAAAKQFSTQPKASKQAPSQCCMLQAVAAAKGAALCRRRQLCTRAHSEGPVGSASVSPTPSTARGPKDPEGPAASEPRRISPR